MYLLIICFFGVLVVFFCIQKKKYFTVLEEVQQGTSRQMLRKNAE